MHAKHTFSVAIVSGQLLHDCSSKGQPTFFDQWHYLELHIVPEKFREYRKSRKIWNHYLAKMRSSLVQDNFFTRVRARAFRDNQKKSTSGIILGSAPSRKNRFPEFPEYRKPWKNYIHFLSMMKPRRYNACRSNSFSGTFGRPSTQNPPPIAPNPWLPAPGIAVFSGISGIPGIFPG